MYICMNALVWEREGLKMAFKSCERKISVLETVGQRVSESIGPA